jgi:hypothetical protein
MSETEDRWVLLCAAHGFQVMQTTEERFANKDSLDPAEYDVPNCELLKNVENYTGAMRTEVMRDLTTDAITVVQRSKGFVHPSHIVQPE